MTLRFDWRCLVLAVLMAMSACEGMAYADVLLETCPLKPSFQCVRGITELTIQDVEYRMDVLVSQLEDLNDTMFHSVFWAGDASKEVVKALNAVGLHNGIAKFFDYGEGAQFFGEGPWSEFILHIPYQLARYMGDPEGAFDSTCPLIYSPRVNDARCFIWTKGQPLAFAVFTDLNPPDPPVKVPEASMLWGLLPGLGFLYIRLRSSRSRA